MTDPKINWDAVFLSNYESTVFCDVHWISKARDLYECARKLEPDVLRVLKSYGAVSRNEGSRLLSDHYQGGLLHAAFVCSRKPVEGCFDRQGR